jgi:hypothetical protein
MKVCLVYNDDAKEHLIGYCIFCPGCQHYHILDSRWAFNLDLEKPTFTPSLMCNRDFPESRCHSFIKDGNIQFLSDCYHSLANQTVELPENDWSG